VGRRALPKLVIEKSPGPRAYGLELSRALSAYSREADVNSSGVNPEFLGEGTESACFHPDASRCVEDRRQGGNEEI